MKSLLICPADRPGVAQLADSAPLVLAPLLGKCLIEYWLEALAARGVKHVAVLASDRPQAVRHFVGDGARWGLQVEVIPQSRELSVVEARVKYLGSDHSLSSFSFSPSGQPQTNENEERERVVVEPATGTTDVILLDTLPGHPRRSLFESYQGWFAALKAFLPHAVTATRIGMHEVQPGIWIGLHAQIDPTAHLHAPCWIGEHALVSAGANLGPGAILEDRVVIEAGARVTESVIGPETFVGELISVQNSLAHGGTLVNWMTDSCLHVPDAFFLCSLGDRRFGASRSGVTGRLLAVAALIVTAPIALTIMLLSVLRGENPLVLRLGVRPQRNVRVSAQRTFAYHELAGGSNWLKRWPQFWSVARGDLAWVGNRPLRPTQALGLGNDFERLWLTAPVGLVSLADANGCTDGLNDETCAHASYYAVNASTRLNWFVLSRALFRAALAWPIRWPRRKHAAVPLQQLAPKQGA